ncbi:MAG: GAF domain-containing protein, partial [bacterium]|nr:GAF domain-containing protein [bacterium]
TLENVLNKLMVLVKELIDADGTSILLYSEEMDSLYFAVVTGEKKEILKDLYIPKGKGIAGYVFETGESVLIEDVSTDTRWSSLVDDKTGFKTQSIIAVPLKVNDRIIGVVEGINKKTGGRFTKKDLRMLMTFSNSAAIAIYKAKQYEELERTLWLTLNTISDIVNPFDTSQKGRTLRISEICEKLSLELDLSKYEVSILKWAVVLNEIGKLLIPPEILEKKELLTNEEYEIILRVPKMIGQLFPGLKKFKDVIPIIENVYERYDGTGPNHKKVDEIPILSRILSVAIAFESLTTDKPYRKKLSYKGALDEIKKFEGLQFDPYVVGALEEVLKKESKI